jgi:anti-sigma regulatory factor (Ser/Thr protein kinase)
MTPSVEATITMTADINNLPKFREFIQKQGERAGLSDDTLFDLSLVVDEACTNVITHGYEGRSAGEIALTLQIFADQARITITDHGRAFDPDKSLEPDINARWQDRRIGGLGWHLINEMTDEANYHSDPGQGNRLVLVKMINQDALERRGK